MWFSLPYLCGTSLKSFICRLSDLRAGVLLRGSEEHRESSDGSALFYSGFGEAEFSFDAKKPPGNIWGGLWPL